MNIRTHTLLVTAVAATFTLAGCSSGSNDATTDTISGNADTTETSAAPGTPSDTSADTTDTTVADQPTDTAEPTPSTDWPMGVPTVDLPQQQVTKAGTNFNAVYEATEQQCEDYLAMFDSGWKQIGKQNMSGMTITVFEGKGWNVAVQCAYNVLNLSVTTA
jgi:outer membrane murein-binding lipoprotein Lpp